MAPERGAGATLNWPNAITVSRLLLAHGYVASAAPGAGAPHPGPSLPLPLALACATVGVLSGANYLRYALRSAR